MFENDQSPLSLFSVASKRKDMQGSINRSLQSEDGNVRF